MASGHDMNHTASLGSASASDNETVNTNNQAVALGRDGKDVIGCTVSSSTGIRRLVAPRHGNAILAPTVPEMPIASGVFIDSPRNVHLARATESPIRSTEAANATYVTNAIWHAADIEGSSSYQTEGYGRHADEERHTAFARREAYGRQAQSATTENQGKQSIVITLKVRCPLNVIESKECGIAMSLKTKHPYPDKTNEEKPEHMQRGTPPQAANSSTRTMTTRSSAVTASTLDASEAESSTARAPRREPRPDKKRGGRIVMKNHVINIRDSKGE